MRILIATTHVPFIRGGAEAHAEGLRDALTAAGHEAEIVAVPFKWYPPEKIMDHMRLVACLNLTEVAGMPVDLLIGLKIPAYLILTRARCFGFCTSSHRLSYGTTRWGICSLHLTDTEVRDAIRKADVKSSGRPMQCSRIQ